jgi:hypothetical protein
MSNIKKSFIVRNGKRVPFFKIPTGVSGLTAETKSDTKSNDKKSKSNYRTHIEKNDVDEYLETGEINSSEVTDYMSSAHEFSEMELFDKIND